MYRLSCSAAFSKPLCQILRVLIGIPRLFHGSETVFLDAEPVEITVVRLRLMQDKSSGERGNCAECFIVAQTVSHRSETTHGKTCDIAVLSPSGDMEHFTHHCGELFSDEFPVVIIALGNIDIESIVPGRHDHAEIPRLCPALDPGAVHPVGVIAQYAVKQDQHPERLVLGFRHAGKNELVRRQDHVHGNRPQQTPGHEIYG